MENLITRHRNVSILVAVLFAQVLGLAVQVKRANNTESTRLIRIWTVGAIAPFEKALVWMQHGTGDLWHNYVYLRGVRAENRELKQQIEQLRLEQVRLSEDAEQARRLQSLLGFKEKFIAKTVAAQVIGSSGSEQSRSVYIDKGYRDGLQAGQAVITAEGIVGKVLHVIDNSTALVLLVNDQSSGVGVILENSRLQGVLKGTPAGGTVIEKIMADEGVQNGERVLTSGGDLIFPKGLTVGSVSDVSPGADFFLNIRVKPAANLNKLEEVLVVTRMEQSLPAAGEMAERVRAVDVLAQRLPSVPDKPAPNTTPAQGSQTTKPQAAIQGAPPATAPAAVTSQPAKPSQAGASAEVKNPVKASPAASKAVPAMPGIPADAASKPGSKPSDAAAATSKPAPAPAAPRKPAGTPLPPLLQPKPAVAQNPEVPASKPPDKSAKPGPAQPNPQPAPLEDKPQ